MSFLTCFWLLPQNEHFRRSESPNFAIPLVPPEPSGRAPHPASAPILRAARGGRSEFRRDLSARDDFVDQAIVLSLIGRHDEVPVGVLPDLLEGLARVHREDLVDEPPVAKDLLRLDLDVDRLPLCASVRLGGQKAGGRGGESLALRSRRWQQRRSG